jgi:hypothetical protein
MSAYKGFHFSDALVQDDRTTTGIDTDGSYVNEVLRVKSDLALARRKAEWTGHVLGTRPPSAPKDAKKKVEAYMHVEAFAQWLTQFISLSRKLRLLHCLWGFCLGFDHGGPANPFSTNWEEDTCRAFTVNSIMRETPEGRVQLRDDWDMFLSLLLSSLCPIKHAELHLTANSSADEDAYVKVARIVQGLVIEYASAGVAHASDAFTRITDLAKAPVVERGVKARVNNLMTLVRVYHQIYAHMA